MLSPGSIIGIVSALKEEEAAVRAAVDALPEAQRARVKTARGGLGWDMAEKAAKELAATPGLALLCSTGFSGGLVDGLEPGMLCMAERLLPLPPTTASFASNKIDQPLAVNTTACAPALAALKAAGLACRCGMAVTVREPVLQGQEKRFLGMSLKAETVDMESAAVATIARDGKLPVLVLRAISDTVNDDLPPEIAGFLDQSGQLKMGTVAKFAFKNTANVGLLMKLKANADKAAAALTAAWKVVLPALLS